MHRRNGVVNPSYMTRRQWRNMDRILGANVYWKSREKQLGAWYNTVKTDYPEAAPGYPEDMDDWGCGHWKTFYSNLLDVYGKAQAVSKWNIETDRVGMWATGQGCRYDCEWNREMEKLGLDTGSNLFSKIYCGGESVADVASTTTEGVAQIAKFAVPVLAIGAGIWAYNKFIKTN